MLLLCFVAIKQFYFEFHLLLLWQFIPSCRPTSRFLLPVICAAYVDETLYERFLNKFRAATAHKDDGNLLSPM